MTMNQFIPVNLIENRCDQWIGPFRCELKANHEGPHQWDSDSKKCKPRGKETIVFPRD